MLMSTLFHVAIKSPDIEATRAFYCDVLGMTLDERPPLDFPGYWIKAPLPGGMALFHIYGGEAAKEPDGNMASGAGVIDHVAVTCQGYAEMRARFERYGLDYREQILPTIGLWQLFVYDPSGVLLELTFSEEAEDTPTPEFPPERNYRPRENFFDPQSYRSLGA